MGIQPIFNLSIFEITAKRGQKPVVLTWTECEGKKEGKTVGSSVQDTNTKKIQNIQLVY
jgi:hypothetical protein